MLHKTLMEGHGLVSPHRLSVSLDLTDCPSLLSPALQSLRRADLTHGASCITQTQCFQEQSIPAGSGDGERDGVALTSPPHLDPHSQQARTSTRAHA